MPRAGEQIGPYTLVKQLGRGAFGLVWLAERRGAFATTQVALKLALDEEPDLEAITQESQLWAQLGGHPNVLPIIEADRYDDQVVIVSEYAPSGSLEGWLKNNQGVSPNVEAATSMVLGILAGLEHLHSRRIIHRDLKPANILLQGETPRLADFGLARVLKSTSQSAGVAGTPAYMAPETFSGIRSEQSDIWSAGVIFYQLLTGRLPYPQTDIIALIGAISTREPEPLPDYVPEHIKQTIARAMEKDPARRFRTCGEMRAMIMATEKSLRPNIINGVTKSDESFREMPTEQLAGQHHRTANNEDVVATQVHKKQNQNQTKEHRFTDTKANNSSPQTAPEMGGLLKASNSSDSLNSPETVVNTVKAITPERKRTLAVSIITAALAVMVTFCITILYVVKDHSDKGAKPTTITVGSNNSGGTEASTSTNSKVVIIDNDGKTIDINGDNSNIQNREKMILDGKEIGMAAASQQMKIQIDSLIKDLDTKISKLSEDDEFEELSDELQSLKERYKTVNEADQSMGSKFAEYKSIYTELNVLQGRVGVFHMNIQIPFQPEAPFTSEIPVPPAPASSLSNNGNGHPIQKEKLDKLKHK